MTDPTGRADRLVRLLQHQLEARARAKVGKQRPAATAAHERLNPRELVARLGPGDRPALRRALVEALIAQRFDPSVQGEPRFQRIVDEVMAIVADNEGLSELLSRALADGR